jgi:hypothetical protein
MCILRPMSRGARSTPEGMGLAQGSRTGRVLCSVRAHKLCARTTDGKHRYPVEIDAKFHITALNTCQDCGCDRNESKYA